MATNDLILGFLVAASRLALAFRTVGGIRKSKWLPQWDLYRRHPQVEWFAPADPIAAIRSVHGLIDLIEKR